jgi:NarL family two-component system response regulator YdfI
LTRIVLAAASTIVRKGLEAMLAGRSDLAVVGTVRDWLALQGIIDDINPDVIVVLVERQNEDPPGELQALATIPVVVLMDDPQPWWVNDALRQGVRAVLRADATADELAGAIHAVAAGLLVLHPQDAQPVLTAAAAQIPRATDRSSEALTHRETEVLRMLARGFSNKEIAARLVISEHTVKFHVASVMGKLGAGTRTEAVTMGLRQGLILL